MNWELIYKLGITGIGGFFGYLFGGWGGLVLILLSLMLVDYITGNIASWVEGTLSSKVGFKGIAKKVTILFVVVVANLIDQALISAGLIEGQIVRDATIFFYIGNEVLSFFENVGRMGVPLPTQLTNAVAVLKGKGEGK